ncbi:MAG: alpha/beta hydrolase [Candidatus Limnocylindrales bacterium]
MTQAEIAHPPTDPTWFTGDTLRTPGPMETEGIVRGVGDMELVWRRWAPVGSPRAAVAIVHGFGEHSGRYAHVAATLTGAGLAVHAIDSRGHGRSPGQRGHIDAWSDHRGDVAAFVDHVRSVETHGTPTFLYGHSLGGAIVLEYVLHRADGLDGVIASAPGLVLTGLRNAPLEALAGVMSRIWPSFSIDVPFENEALSRSPEVLEAARNDPLIHRRLSARATTETLAALTWTRANAGSWRLPLFIYHGTGDRIVDPAGSIAFADDARAGGAPDVTLRLYEGVYHEPHNDLDAAQVLADVTAWLDARLPARSKE